MDQHWTGLEITKKNYWCSHSLGHPHGNSLGYPISQCQCSLPSACEAGARFFSRHFEIQFRSKGVFTCRAIAKKKKFRIFAFSAFLFGYQWELSKQSSHQIGSNTSASTSKRYFQHKMLMCAYSHQLNIQSPSWEHYVDARHPACTCSFCTQ